MSPCSSSAFCSVAPFSYMDWMSPPVMVPLRVSSTRLCRLGAKTAGLVDSFEHCHRHIRMESWRACHLAHHVDALAAEGGSAHIHLRALDDELGKADDRHFADLAGCLANLQRARR